MVPLFEQYPLLQEKLPYAPLCEFPTPVQKLERLGAELGVGRLYVKRDDLSGSLYGGNKPRKLEFILAEALRSGAREVMTFGGAGSNHALATAIYARKVGLNSISMLTPQPNARYVRRNLLMGHKSGAELHLCGADLESARNMPLVYAAAVYQLLRHRLKRGRFPRLIPPGGSSPLGLVGFVNAALELRKQIVAGEMPEPDYVYVACGSMGTAGGLALGLRAAGLGGRVVPVAVHNESFTNTGAMIKLIGRTNSLLCSLDASFPKLEFSEADVDIRHDCAGRRYALFTDEGMEAVSRMKECEGIKLDGTYTGKTLAALKRDAGNGGLRDRAVLFWNTLNSRDFSGAVSDVDYHDLPRSFHRYFEEEVQPLDRDE
jgi:1-aminocyclopropane-1-carboxylate deaminase/D-cysteine desulfhydrase-like pyridoxal-dependent ACC family enzyme